MSVSAKLFLIQKLSRNLGLIGKRIVLIELFFTRCYS